jgi:hypothetical protein
MVVFVASRIHLSGATASLLKYIYVTLIRISPLGEMVKVGSVLRRDAVAPLK